MTSLSKWDRRNDAKVSLIMNEIVESEAAYVNNLKLLSDRFIKPLRHHRPVLKKTLSIVEDLINVHELIHGDLATSHTTNGDDVELFMAVFLRYADFLKIYSTFVNEYEKLYNVIKNMANDSEFQAFLQERRKDPALRGNNLMAFLIMPVQRIPQYVLLVDRLLRASGGQSEQSANALNRIRDLAQYLNDRKREMEQRSIILDIASRITGDDTFVLLSPSRRFVKQGELLKLSTLNFKKRRNVYLFNDLLLWTTLSFRIRGYMDLANAVLEEESVSLQNTPQSTPVQNRKVPVSTPVDGTNRKQPLFDEYDMQDGSSLIEDRGGVLKGDKSPRKNKHTRRVSKAVEMGAVDPTVAFEVLHPNKKTPLVLIASSVSEKNEWVKAIRQAIASSARTETDLNLRREEVVSPSNQDHALSEYLSSKMQAQEPVVAKSRVKLQKRRSHRSSQSHRGLDSIAAQSVNSISESAVTIPDSPERDAEGKEVTRVLHSVLKAAFQSTALQQLEDSITALQAITDRNIAMLWVSTDTKSDTAFVADPSLLVRKVLEACTISMGVDGVDDVGESDMWGEVTRRFVQQAHFLRLLKGHASKRLRIRSNQMAKLKSYITNPLLQIDRIAQESAVAAILWNWVRSNYSCQPGAKKDMVLSSQPPTFRLDLSKVEKDGPVRARTPRSVRARRKRSKSMKKSIGKKFGGRPKTARRRVLSPRLSRRKSKKDEHEELSIALNVLMGRSPKNVAKSPRHLGVRMGSTRDIK